MANNFFNAFMPGGMQPGGVEDYLAGLQSLNLPRGMTALQGADFSMPSIQAQPMPMPIGTPPPPFLEPAPTPSNVVPENPWWMKALGGVQDALALYSQLKGGQGQFGGIGQTFFAPKIENKQRQREDKKKLEDYTKRKAAYEQGLNEFAWKQSQETEQSLRLSREKQDMIIAAINESDLNEAEKQEMKLHVMSGGLIPLRGQKQKELLENVKAAAGALDKLTAEEIEKAQKFGAVAAAASGKTPAQTPEMARKMAFERGAGAAEGRLSVEGNTGKIPSGQVGAAGFVSKDYDKEIAAVDAEIKKLKEAAGKKDDPMMQDPQFQKWYESQKGTAGAGADLMAAAVGGSSKKLVILNKLRTKRVAELQKKKDALMEAKGKAVKTVAPKLSAKALLYADPAALEADLFTDDEE